MGAIVLVVELAQGGFVTNMATQSNLVIKFIMQFV